jgi:hypothetical protein
MSEPDADLEQIERELDRRGLLLHLDEVGPGRWHASAVPKGPGLAGMAPSATAADASEKEAAAALLRLLDEES